MAHTLLNWICSLSWTTWMLLLLLIWFIGNYYRTTRPWLNLPPGPPVFPGIGSAPFILLASLDIRKALYRLSGYYGDIFTLYLGSRRVVVLNGYDVIKEALLGKHGRILSGRPNILALNILSNYGHGISGTQGHHWQEQRRYTLHMLRNFGLGTSNVEDIVKLEVKNLLGELCINLNKPLDPRPLFSKATSNVISAIAFGERLEYDDDVFTRFVDIVGQVLSQLGGVSLLHVYPWLRHLPGDWVGYKKLMEHLEQLNKHHKHIIDDHRRRIASGEKPTDLIGSYLLELQKRREEPDSTFSELDLLTIVNDLFLAGTDTTSATLTWALLYMVRHPHLQNKIYEELHSVLGPEIAPSVHHRPELPYMDAFMAEVMRVCNVIPVMVPHAPLEDTTFRGYHLPRGTMIMLNNYSVDMDPTVYDDPETFNPERFLDAKGRYRRQEKQITFGMGKRVCLGENLARIEVFLFIATMVQKYRFRLPEGAPLPDTNGINGANYQPKPFLIIAESRKVMNECTRRFDSVRRIN